MVQNFDRKTRTSAASNAAAGVQIVRPQPHNVDFEQALLACCIMEGGQDSIALCLQNKISAASFYLPAHRLLWETMVDICNAGKPVDEIFLADRLESAGKLEAIGGVDFIGRICDRIDTPAHVTHYIKRVRDLELVRRVIAASIANIERAYDDCGDLDDFMEKAENEIFSISADRVIDCAVPVKKSIDAAINTIQLMLNHRGELTGLASGFADLDRVTFGFRHSEMIVIAARPSMGKTSLALNIAENVILPKQGREPAGVLFFSLEMSSEQLAMRMLCGRAGVNMTKLHDGFIPKRASEALSNVARELKDSMLWIDESTNLTILEMRAKARRICNREKIGLIVIDYLQLIGGDNRIPREQQIAEISRGVKAMAKEIKVPVIVLSQLNRDSEKERRKPRLSDLRESGAIEQDADVVLILAKQAQVGGKSKDDDRDKEEDDEFNCDTVIRDLVIAKHRNGPIGVVPLAFVRSLTRFENYIDEKVCD
ncbi:MAG: replicative DNA helicase [Puniceicoccales bacterium]|jgi:replicative DNA helicase|nr:replicative DNA helicase [Puniceicoccales bacterium]